MKTTLKPNLLAVVLVSTLAFTSAQAQQYPNPTTAADVPGPAAGNTMNWLPAPNGTFSLYIRAYWPDKAILDGTWLPPAIEKVK